MCISVLFEYCFILSSSLVVGRFDVLMRLDDVAILSMAVNPVSILCLCGKDVAKSSSIDYIICTLTSIAIYIVF